MLLRMETIPPFKLTQPDAATPRLPVLVSSPHSGAYYPPEFLRASRLDAYQIRKSEDMFVADLWSGIEAFGASLLAATFPRAYLDLNRAADELEPALFADKLPHHIDRKSSRAAAGLGTVPRLVAENEPIYPAKLTYADAQARIKKIYEPFHRQLADSLAAMRAEHGFAVLLDTHSMPSQAVKQLALNPPGSQIDFVLGNRHGQSCAPALSNWVRDFLTARHYRVEMNRPYAGGHISQHYGQPANGCHALQIEINRAIYMDEDNHTKHVGFEKLRTDLLDLGQELTVLLASLAAQLQGEGVRPAAE